MKKNFLSPDLKLLIPYLAIFIGLIVVFIFGYTISVKEVSSQNQRLKKAKDELTMLSQKEATLQSIKANILTSADDSLSAVPAINPALVVVTQIKTLAAQKALLMSDLQVSSPTEVENLRRAQVTFDLAGPLVTVVEFCSQLKDLAPIVLLEKLTTTGDVGDSVASVTITSFWADLPTNIGSLTEPLGNLSGEDQEMLNKFSLLQKPSFIQLIPQAPVIREDPFN